MTTALDMEHDYAVCVTMTASRSKGFANVVVVMPDGTVVGFISTAAWQAFMAAVKPTTRNSDRPVRA
jgi:hypothetical protein